MRNLDGLTDAQLRAEEGRLGGIRAEDASLVSLGDRSADSDWMYALDFDAPASEEPEGAGDGS